MTDVFRVVKHSFMETANALKGSGILFLPFAIAVYIVATLLNMLLNVQFSTIASPILLYLLRLTELSILAKALNNVVTINRFPKKGLFTNFGVYFINIMNTYFIIYVAKIILNTFAFSLIRNVEYTMLYNVIVFIIEDILLSALYEAVYIDGVGGLSAFKAALVFMKNNALPWIMLNIPYYFLMAGKFFYGEIRMFNVNKLAAIAMIIAYPLFMVLKGKAYLYLSQTTKRKRRFMDEYNR